MPLESFGGDILQYKTGLDASVIIRGPQIESLYLIPLVPFL